VLPLRRSTTLAQDLEQWKRFFNLTGASLLYCLSAILTVYGIVNILGPMLAWESNTLRDALPCIFTLHAYELALLGVLILIVSKKVIDDAVSVAVLAALFLVGTSIALGSVADKGINASFFVGLVGVGLAAGKFFAMRRFARIPFRALAVIGLVALIACNYFGPVLLARSIVTDPTQEPARRGLWLSIVLTMVISAGLVIAEAMRANPNRQEQQENRPPFLQRPVMVYVFALILVLASGIHQYAMAYTCALERVLGDFVPLIAVAALLSLEILRHYGKRFGFTEIIISSVPLGVVMLAIDEKSVLASGEFGVGLICYPPVLLALCGLAFAVVALRHRWYWLLGVVAAYGMGVILTIGFSPQDPYALNYHACFGTIAIALLVYGIVIRNPYLCLGSVIVLCFGLGLWDAFSEFAHGCGLTHAGAVAGAAGLGIITVWFVFGGRLHKVVRVFGTICLALFVFDYLPAPIHWRYLVVLIGIGLLMAGAWLRTRDPMVVSILWVPLGIRLYVLAKQMGHWRSVILGFLVLAAGAFVSLLKRSGRNRTVPQDDEESW
jgi:hypothetical protein